MKLNYDRLESLIKESGKSKAYLCAKVNRERYYMRDLKNANTNVPEETVEIWADELGTTPEYLTGESDERRSMTRFFEQYSRLCKERGMSANGAAKEIGLPSSSVTNWKQGRTPRLDKVEKIAEYFGVSADYLLGYTDEKEKPAAQMGDELSPEFASLFSCLTPEQKELVLATMRELAKGK